MGVGQRVPSKVMIPTVFYGEAVQLKGRTLNFFSMKMTQQEIVHVCNKKFNLRSQHPGEFTSKGDQLIRWKEIAQHHFLFYVINQRIKELKIQL